MIKLKTFLSYATIFLLTSCKAQPVNYTYLMQHPLKLQQAAKQCQTNSSDTENCQMVFSAARDFTEILSEQQRDPEKFGQKLLAEQLSCSAEDPAAKSCQNVKIWLAVIGVNTPE